MDVKPQDQHRWLHRMVGSWTVEGECSMGPGVPTESTTGTETVRSLGGLWVIAEGRGKMPDGGEPQHVMTLGYDPEKGAFVGSFIASMGAMMWVYDGRLDTAAQRLTLACEGPDFANPGKRTSFRDIITLQSDDARTLTSEMQAADGAWHQIMTARYHRIG
ncbi:DUF1579 domain-containing protein [Humitalea sp. 24SJ18S-53]|uniref:DUF1579 domain-containing protein n=1 Tax=Humitalea sp. 24SJ18S-53 TaxID=3422307 RepID=UPI003D67E2B5